jgi:ribosomal protein L37AE/L43A
MIADPHVIVDPHGQPARRREDTSCPKCRAPKDRRVASGGFGTPHAVCGACGHDFFTEPAPSEAP